MAKDALIVLNGFQMKSKEMFVEAEVQYIRKTKMITFEKEMKRNFIKRIKEPIKKPFVSEWVIEFNKRIDL